MSPFGSVLDVTAGSCAGPIYVCGEVVALSMLVGVAGANVARSFCFCRNEDFDRNDHEACDEVQLTS